MPKPKQSSHRELHHQRKIREERERSAVLPPGLINHGNTCFMNSVLQGLIATRLMHDLVTFAPVPAGLQCRLPVVLDSGRSPQLTNGHGVAGSYEQPWIDSMPIGDQFIYLMCRAWDSQSDRKRESLSPKPLLNALGRKYQQYLDFTQQDAHEFLRILFDAMRMEEVDVIKKRQPQVVKSPKKRRSTPGTKRRRPPSSASHSDTPSDTLLPFTDMLFAGQLTSILVCQTCKNISQTYEDFYDISLSIKPEDYATSSTSPPSSAAGKNLFSLRRSTTGVKEKSKDSENDGHEHGTERRRDKFKKFAKRITTFQGPSAQDDAGKAGSVELAMPRPSSVPPGKGEEIQLAEVKSRIRRQRSRSLDHLNRVARPDMGNVNVADGSRERDGLEDDQASGEGSTGRDEANTTTGPSTTGTIESDWSVVRNGEAEPEEEAPPVSEGKNKQKVKDREDDGWVKLGKKLSLLTRHRDKEPRSREGVVEEIRAKKSRESSPDTGGVSLSGRSTPLREHSGTPPPVPPKKIRPVSTPPSVSPPALHHLPHSVPPFPFSARNHHDLAVKSTSLSPLSQPPYQASQVETSAQSGGSSFRAFHLNHNKARLTHSHQTPSTYKHRPHTPPHTPTPAEVEYLRRIMADIDLLGSESSATPSSSWSPIPSTPALVNPFALLMKSGAAKKGTDSNDIVGKSDAVATEASAAELPSHTRSQKWSSWLGINRVSGLEECLRLFMSVEVLNNENMVGCRRCWKVANQEKERETQNGNEDGEDEDESSSEEEGESPLQPPSSSPGLGQVFTRQPEVQASTTPGGMPIPTISTTGPESPLEPPPRLRAPQPLRSNSADFISLSVISSREQTDALGLTRNASSPSIPSTIVSPQITPYPSYSFPPFAMSSQYQSPTIRYSQSPEQLNGMDSLVIPQVPMTRRRTTRAELTDGESDESTSAMDSRSSGEDGDDRASIGSSSSFSASRSGDSSAPRSLSDSGYGKTEEDPQHSNGLVDGISANSEVREPDKGESKNAVKRPKRPKPVIMRPAYKRYLIATAPPVLVVHLKRFQQTDKAPLLSFTPTYGFKKLDDYVTFPEYLDLTPFLAPRKEESELDQKDIINGDVHGPGKRRMPSEKHEKCLYRLYAIVVHLGHMLGGHYIAYTAISEQRTMPNSSGTALPSGSGDNEAKPGSSSSSTTAASSIAPPKSSKSARSERQWAYISDTSVRLATLEEVLKAKAYICMYERI
ncbi:hypothetical protein APHAL10511_002877 [Amanita phalloides]|nr:hypothetical protein APHAL10511_002877 [Amanita phalloides]